MLMRLGGMVLICLVGFPAGQAAAQYPYPPPLHAEPYGDDIPPRYVPRRYHRLPPGYDEDDDVVDEVIVLERHGGYSRFVRRYYRVVPGPYDDPPPRPYFRRGYPDGIGPANPQAIPEGRSWRDRRAALPPAAEPQGRERQAALPSDLDDTIRPQAGQLAPRLRRQIVDYRTKEPAGAIIVDTRNTFLYYVLGDGRAVRYGIGVGREGFAWSGREKVSRMAEWPDWYPPKDMLRREPYLPRMMAGGPGNPLGARALYLGNSLYRIHGTSDPSSIGKHVSSGCIRLLNEDIADLYSRVKVGTRVVVLRGGKRPATASANR